MRGGSAGREGCVCVCDHVCVCVPLALPRSFFLPSMYFKVLRQVISEGGSTSSASQMNALSILVVLIKTCVCACVC